MEVFSWRFRTGGGFCWGRGEKRPCPEIAPADLSVGRGDVSQTNTRCFSGPRLRRLNPPTAHGFLDRGQISQAPCRRSNPRPPTVAGVPPADRLQLGLKKEKL